MPLAKGVYQLAILIGLMFLSNAIIPPTMDALVRRPFDFTNAESSAFMSIPSIAQLIFGIVFGLWSDRTGRRIPMLATGLIGGGICFSLLPHVSSWNAMLALRFVEGTFSVMASTLIFARALDLLGEDNRSRGMAVVTAGLPLGYLCGPILAYHLGDYSLGALYLAGGLPLVLGGFWILGSLRHEGAIKPNESSISEMVDALRRTPGLAVPLLFGFVDKFTFGTLAVLTSFVLKDVYSDGTVATAGVVTSGLWVAFLVGCYPASKIIERVGPWWPLTIGSALYGLAFMGLGHGSIELFTALMAVCGFLSAIMYIPSFVLLGKMVSPGERGTAMAVFNTVGMVGMIVGLVTASHLSDVSYVRAYTTAGALEILAAAIGLVCMTVFFGHPRRLAASPHAAKRAE